MGLQTSQGWWCNDLWTSMVGHLHIYTSVHCWVTQHTFPSDAYFIRSEASLPVTSPLILITNNQDFLYPQIAIVWQLRCQILSNAVMLRKHWLHSHIIQPSQTSFGVFCLYNCYAVIMRMKKQWPHSHILQPKSNLFWGLLPLYCYILLLMMLMLMQNRILVWISNLAFPPS